MNSQKVVSILHAHFTELLANRLAGIYLFGSRARGDNLPDSDMDILLVLEGDFNPFDLIEQTSSIIATVSLQYDIVISLAFISRERFENENTPFMLNVRREGVQVGRG